MRFFFWLSLAGLLLFTTFQLNFFESRGSFWLLSAACTGAAMAGAFSLRKLGWSALLRAVGRDRPVCLAFLGLDNTGKTTLLHLAKTDRLTMHCPGPVHFAETIFPLAPGVRGIAFDRGLKFLKYKPCVEAIVFMVDAADPMRFAEARENLMATLALDVMQGKPVLILGNKIDRTGAATLSKLAQALSLTLVADTHRRERLLDCAVNTLLIPRDLALLMVEYDEPPDLHFADVKSNASSVSGAPCRLCMCSVVKRVGYKEGFAWLADQCRRQ
jgi:GTPase SAR1 family protein